MREPARMEDPLLAESLNDHGTLSRVADFTPINGHSDTAPIDSEHTNTTIKSATKFGSRKETKASAIRCQNGI